MNNTIPLYKLCPVRIFNLSQKEEPERRLAEEKGKNCFVGLEKMEGRNNKERVIYDYGRRQLREQSG